MSPDNAFADGGDPVTVALGELRRGRMVIVADDAERENEGDLIMAAEMASPEALAFMIRNTTGLICVGLTDERADELALPLMVPAGDDPRCTAFTVSVDLKAGTTTGVSAADRALTIRALADSATSPHELSRPGHVFPLRARAGGVLERPGHTESAVDLCRLAGLAPVGMLAEVINDDGTMARCPQLAQFAREHDLALITVADIVRYRARREASGRIPTSYGEFTAIAFRMAPDAAEHVALVLGDVDQSRARGGTPQALPVLTRVHSECLTGDVFSSLRCDCGAQLDQALAKISAAGRGVIIYLRGHEGRGVGLSHKLRAYTLQDEGLDTVDANLAQGLPIDDREYSAAARILQWLGIRDVTLMTNNPEKCDSLQGRGLRVSGREPVVVVPNPDNVAYLTTKRKRMGHHLTESVVS